MNIEIPAGARMVLRCLEEEGYTAYLVGGCVRDSLLNRRPGDWDIATSARPEQVIACFADYPVLKTGLQHGTVTVLIDHCPYEVTTFRVDGAYTDNRRPDRVEFVDDLREDLARRDFTVNALAFHPTQGLLDYFGGQEDLAAGRIACVGDPAVRFGEDALRILRAVRFSSVLQFAIAPDTAAAMARLAPSLVNIAPERIRVELDKAILGPGMRRAFSGSPEVLEAVFPEMKGRMSSRMWAPALQAVDCAPHDVAVRLALLLGGSGGQAAGSAKSILLRLRYDNDTRLRVERLIRWSGEDVSASPISIRHWLNRLGEEDFRRLLELWRARGRGEELDAVQGALQTVLDEKQCYRLRDLAVSGDDLLEIGVPKGRRIGELLEGLLEGVIEERLPNDRSALLQEVRRRL